ncbi:peptide ABC transporter substrate-binding protein [Weissella bombi]|uniref:Oligopeptide transport system substrate-binding protein n=1 Tax=Weissella bombi TaxID=1505725 RepID=A0A1C4BMK3_9LACO|nr:peptide ABC transporter substrate-binding protein [Weissella bombi]SCC08105.1 oligopeptide transport system substrate-binding protein [Weissella bombi]
MNKTLKVSALLSGAVILGSAVVPVTASAAKYKTINWTETANVGTMDPSKTTAAIDFTYLQSIGEGLYRTDQSGKPALAGATSVDKSDDGLTLTYHLRDAKWSNGDPVTANDYVYGWQRTNDPKTASQYAYLFSGIKNADAIQKGDKPVSDLGVKAIDDKTLEVTLDRPMPQLESVMTMATFEPQNKKFVDKVGKKYGTASKYTISNGPFIMKGWTGSNNKISLVKNKDYWDAKTVKTPKVNIQTIKDQNTGYNLYKSKKVDYTTLSPDQYKASKNKKDFTVISQASTAFIEFNENKKPLDNTNIRKALSKSIDRSTMSSKILGGGGKPAYSFTATKLAKDPNSGKDFAKVAADKKASGYDLKAAKKLWKQGLKETGKKKVNLQYLTDDTDGAKRSAQFIQSQMEKLPGLKVTIKTVPFKQRISLSDDKKFDMVNTIWGGDYADPSTFLDLYTSDSSFNNGSWKNADYDKLMSDAKTTDVNDEKKRYQDYADAEKLLQEDAAIAPVYYQAKPSLLNTSVKDVVSNTTGAPFDWKWAYKK